MICTFCIKQVHCNMEYHNHTETTKKETLRYFIKAVMFYHVVLSCMVNEDEQYNFELEENDDECCK